MKIFDHELVMTTTEAAIDLSNKYQISLSDAVEIIKASVIMKQASAIVKQNDLMKEQNDQIVETNRRLGDLYDIIDNGQSGICSEIGRIKK